MKKLDYILLLILLARWVGGCAQPPTPNPLADGGVAETAQVEFTLTTGIIDGKMAFIGVGGEIDGLANPDLNVQAGELVRIVLVNGEGVPHDLALPDLGAQTSLLTSQGQSAELLVTAPESGTFAYYCTVAGHRQAGMEGRLIANNPQS